MTDRPESTRPESTRPESTRAVLALLVALALPASAQPVTWEAMPGVRRLPTDPDRIVAVGFLRGEGAQASDPAADTLVVISSDGGAFLYNPSGAAGAAGSNGEWGVWHQLCSNGQCAAPAAGVVTAAGSVVIGGNGATGHSRGAGRGRTWALNYTGYGAFPFLQTTAAEPVGALLVGIGDDGLTARSLSDGAPGTWAVVGSGLGFPQSFGEVPPSAALPNGRILMGVWDGVTYSDDGGLTYVPSSAYGPAAYIVWSFTFMPEPGHPYGGVAFAGVQDIAFGGEFAGAAVLRSDDGGATWAVGHRFTAAEVGLPVPGVGDVTEVELLSTADGAVWAGVSFSTAFGTPARGSVMRSADGGATWSRTSGGFDGGDGRGYAVAQFAASRTGVLYAATSRGVWRTTGPAVTAESSPVMPDEVGVSVRPNPAGGRVEVVVSLAEGGPVRVVVVDALGREVAVVLDGEAAAGERSVGVDTSSWPAGVYVVRAEASGRVASARLVVAR